MAEQLYPKRARRRFNEEDPWHVHYCDMVYDNGHASWKQSYRTKLGARVSAYFHEHFRSWGGHVVLSHRDEDDDNVQ